MNNFKLQALKQTVKSFFDFKSLKAKYAATLSRLKEAELKAKDEKAKAIAEEINKRISDANFKAIEDDFGNDRIVHKSLCFMDGDKCFYKDVRGRFWVITEEVDGLGNFIVQRYNVEKAK